MFELILSFHRLLSGVKITDEQSLLEAITVLHRQHQLPHIIVTSVRFDENPDELFLYGSTSKSDMSPRLFKLTAPNLPVFFSGTGDMLAALTVARFREACSEADLLSQASWRSPDDVEAQDLPLAHTAGKVLASMHAVLSKTMGSRDAAVKRIDEEVRGMAEGEKKKHLRLTKAAEVKVVRNVKDLIDPPEIERFAATAVGLEVGEAKTPDADELGVVKTGVGHGEAGAVHQT